MDLASPAHLDSTSSVAGVYLPPKEHPTVSDTTSTTTAWTVKTDSSPSEVNAISSTPSASLLRPEEEPVSHATQDISSSMASAYR